MIKILIPYIIGAVFILGSGYFIYKSVYNKAYTDGYAIAEQKYTKQITDLVTSINTKVESLENSSVALASTLEDTRVHNEKLMRDILKTVNGKPLFTIAANGVCSPSADFTSAYNRAVKAANEKK